MSDFTLHQGTAPLLVSLPHDGTALPAAVEARASAAGKRVPDTDWHVGKLYAFAHELGASVITPHWSRYVVDLNRDPEGHKLYPGRTETALVPVTTFAGQPIYAAGDEPHEKEIALRTAMYWQPYHDALAGELQRLREQHPRVVLWDGHSIKSRVPMFFEGRLPDFNLGTAAGASCSPTLQARLSGVLRERAVGSDGYYSHVVNGRFKGGYITRHYGRPETGVEAVQLELAQSTYMDEDSFEYLPERAAPVQAIIRALLETCLAHATGPANP
ncbi:MAG TPA: N-formylglutamate deformylase [Rhodanobacteraceae bacterium]|jgi:N-formylglutamate deformylase|nr:N-formylglutamate deformylase [Rhodanobacteraceae bacterium]